MTENDIVSGDNACPCFGCQCEPNQVTKDAIHEARNAIHETRNRNDSRGIEMTHDELRDYIDKFDAAGRFNEPAVKALRAVLVELHRRDTNEGENNCRECYSEDAIEETRNLNDTR